MTTTPSRPRATLQSVLQSTGSGFLYGTLFGSIIAVVEGLRAAPEHQRLRGAFHHAKAEVPKTAGRIAMVTLLFRVTSLGLESARGGKKDMWNVLLAAPIAGGLLKIRHGPRAALNSAFLFGTMGWVMVGFNQAEARVTKHKESPDTVLEEIAFAEELE